MIKIGIDPGVKTGIAIKENGEFVSIKSGTIIEAMDTCMKMLVEEKEIHVYVEDARLRRWFGKAGRERLQGAGSIKRDCAIWECFLKHFGFKYTMISPLCKGGKLDSNTFKSLTGWQGRTNEHARDAATLIF